MCESRLRPIANARYACYGMLCAGLCQKKYRLMIFISRPKHMRILDKRTRKKWVYFRNAKCNRNQTKQQQKLKYEGEKRKKTRVPTIKRWCIQTPPCIESTSRTCATSPRYNGFYSVLLLISEVYFHFIFVYIIIIVSQLHLFTPIYASWLILCSVL